MQHTELSRSHWRNTNFRRSKETSEKNRFRSECKLYIRKVNCTRMGRKCVLERTISWGRIQKGHFLVPSRQSCWKVQASCTIFTVEGFDCIPPWTTIPRTLDHQGSIEQLLFGTLLPCLLSRLKFGVEGGLTEDMRYTIAISSKMKWARLRGFFIGNLASWEAGASVGRFKSRRRCEKIKMVVEDVDASESVR